MSAERWLTAEQLSAELHGLGVERTPQQILQDRRDGALAANGGRVRLRARRLGRTFYFTLDDVDEFARALAETVVTEPPKRSTSPAKSTRSVLRSVAEAERALDAAWGA